ncbi:hypothetical protein [Shewanella halifaxensis]|uniref:hypothetical protein n=1 Tax=Shewanella halifaxensis TaxID=271098 RepID=UPI000314D2E0|nr:hypothetical protein [Shewanella halifaxensis]
MIQRGGGDYVHFLGVRPIYNKLQPWDISANCESKSDKVIDGIADKNEIALICTNKVQDHCCNSQ